MVRQENNLKKLAVEFVNAFTKQNLSKMSNLMHHQVKAHISNANAEIDLVIGQANLLKRLTMDVAQANLALNITQFVNVTDNMVMFMVEIIASMNNKKLHNFSTFLFKISEQQIEEMWMVEALPFASDEFWRKTN